MIRLFNRLVAFVVGAALAAGGVLVVIEGFSTWINSGFVFIPGAQWLSTTRTTPWSATIVVAISAAVAILGLALLIFEIRPQRKRVVPYHTDTAGEWLLLRRSAESHLARQLSAQVPATPITARLEPKATKWSLTVKAKAAASTRPVLESAGRSELASLHAPQASLVRVKTTGSPKAP